MKIDFKQGEQLLGKGLRLSRSWGNFRELPLGPTVNSFLFP